MSGPPPPVPRPGGLPPPVPPPGGLLPPGGQADCTSLREQLLTLQAQLKEDIAQLNQLLSSPPSLGVTQTQDQIQQWQQTVALKNDEVQYVRGQMEAAGCFETPPRPPPPVVFTEMGPSSIVDGDGKVVGTGAVVDVAVQPGSSDVIFAATAGGGVWQTTNGSSAAPVWATTTDALPSTAMGAVAFALADASGQTVYAGTGTFSSWPSTGPAVGIYKSTDGGDSWTVTGTGLQGQRSLTSWRWPRRTIRSCWPPPASPRTAGGSSAVMTAAGRSRRRVPRARCGAAARR